MKVDGGVSRAQTGLVSDRKSGARSILDNCKSATDLTNVLYGNKNSHGHNVDGGLPPYSAFKFFLLRNLKWRSSALDPTPSHSIARRVAVEAKW